MENIEQSQVEPKAKASKADAKKWYMKKGHGRIFLPKHKKLVIGITSVITKKGGKPEMIYVPLSDAEVALFSEYEKATYLERR